MSKYRVELVRYVPQLFVCTVEAYDTHDAIWLAKRGARSTDPGRTLDSFETQIVATIPITLNLASVTIKKQTI